MGNVSYTVLQAGGLTKVPGQKFDGGSPYMVVASITMSTSYATNGDTLDLSAHFSAIDALIVVPLSGQDIARGAAGATPATEKIKAYQDLKAHQHDLTLGVTGGGAAAGTKALYGNAAVLTKEEAGAGSVTVAGGANAATAVNAPTEVANAQNLSTATGLIIAVGKPA